MPEITFTLKPRPPFRLDLTVLALRRRPHNLVDRFDDGIWRRVLVIDRKPVGIAVRQTGHGDRAEIEVLISAANPDRVKDAVAKSIGNVLGLETDLADFYRIARIDPQLAALAERMRGMKPVRYPTVFEAFANAVTCQMISLSAGMHVLNRLNQSLGVARRIDGVAMRSFAPASAVAQSNPDALRGIGLSRQKAEYLIELAKIGSSSDFADLALLDDAHAVARMRELRGVGRWTAEYVLLRGLGRTNVFPGDDVGGVNKLRAWLSIRDALDYEGVREILRRWHPYAGLIYLLVLASGAG